MFNSIFKKQTILYMSVLSISFILTSVALTQAFRLYFTNQKRDALINQGAKISRILSMTFRPGVFIDRNAFNQLGSQLQIVYEYLESSIVIVDSELNIVAVSEDISPDYQGELLNVPAIEGVLGGQIVTYTGRFGDFYSESVLSVAYPIFMGNMVVGAVVMNSSLPELQKTIGDAYTLIFICLLLSVVISFIMTYLSSKRISRPLLMMNQAAKVIAGGNFDKRIPVESSDEIGQLARSFNEMAASLHGQERIRKEFIANISHDFRSPLTSMRGFLTAIADGTVPADKINYYIDIVLEETNRLTTLADNILDLNKIQNSAMELKMERFDLNELIRKTVLTFEAQIVSKRIDMKMIFDETAYVCADIEKVRRILHNLLDNAIKFTPEDGKVSIETTKNDGKIYVSIKDSGKGVGEDELKRVFERFYKSDASRNEDKLGSGLGLSIVNEFIKVHNEEINIKNIEGGGCEAGFTLSAGG